MPIESATYIHQLDTTFPKGTDQRGTADDHMRLVKKTLVNTFPYLDSEVSASAGELNALVGMETSVLAAIAAVSANLSVQLNDELSAASDVFASALADVSASLQAIITTTLDAWSLPGSCSVAKTTSQNCTATGTVTFNANMTDSNYFSTADSALVVPAGVTAIQLRAHIRATVGVGSYNKLWAMITKNGAQDVVGLPASCAFMTPTTAGVSMAANLISADLSATAGDRFHLLASSSYYLMNTGFFVMTPTRKG